MKQLLLVAVIGTVLLVGVALSFHKPPPYPPKYPTPTTTVVMPTPWTTAFPTPKEPVLPTRTPECNPVCP